MAKFQRKPLGVLDGIFNFVGGLKGVDRIDLGSDVSTVLDLGRMAEKSGYGGPAFGRIRWTDVITLGGASTGRVRCLHSDLATALNLATQDFDWWLLNLGGWCSTADRADLSTVSAAVSGPSTARDAVMVGTPQETLQIIGSWSSAELASRSSGSTDYGALVASGPFSPGLPWRMPRDGALTWNLVSTAAMTLNVMGNFWVGAVGATPPGVP